MTEKKAAYFVHESSYVDEGCEIGAVKLESAAILGRMW